MNETPQGIEYHKQNYRNVVELYIALTSDIAAYNEARTVDVEDEGDLERIKQSPEKDMPSEAVTAVELKKIRDTVKKLIQDFAESTLNLPGGISTVLKGVNSAIKQYIELEMQNDPRFLEHEDSRGLKDLSHFLDIVLKQPHAELLIYFDNPATVKGPVRGKLREYYDYLKINKNGISQDLLNKYITMAGRVHHAMNYGYEETSENFDRENF